MSVHNGTQTLPLCEHWWSRMHCALSGLVRWLRRVHFNLHVVLIGVAIEPECLTKLVVSGGGVGKTQVEDGKGLPGSPVSVHEHLR